MKPTALVVDGIVLTLSVGLILAAFICGIRALPQGVECSWGARGILGRFARARSSVESGVRRALVSGEVHRAGLQIFLGIIVLHWMEHIAQAIEVYVLGWPRPVAGGLIGILFPWLITSEWLHYGFALFMLAGFAMLRTGFEGRARRWWDVALGIQVWHLAEHALLLSQVLIGHNLLGRPVPTSVLQIFFPRMELHLFYNAVVTVPMLAALRWHTRDRWHTRERKGREVGEPRPPGSAPEEGVGRLAVAVRFGQIGVLMGLHGCRLLLRLTRVGFSARARSRRLALLGRSMTELFESLGATFIKLGQILSSRPDLLPDEVVVSLARLQDRVRPVDARRIRGLVESGLGRPLEDVFESFDFTAMSSASIATVHVGRLAGGRDVAVKLRRPGLVKQVRKDLLILRQLARLVSRLPQMRIVPVQGVIAEFSDAIAGQVDLRLEAENLRRFRRNLAGLAGVKIPEPVDELCSESVLTLELLKGTAKVDEVGDLSASQRQRLTSIGLRAVYQMIFVDGFVHADMHPGNVLFLGGDQIVLLDTGLVAVLDEEERLAFMQFFLAMATNDGIECARIVYDTATYVRPDCDRDAFDSAMAALVDASWGKSAQAFDAAIFAYDLFGLQRQFGIRGSTAFTMTIISLVVFQGIVKQLYGQADFQREARDFLSEVLLPSEALGS